MAQKPKLGTNLVDVLAAVTRAGLGAVPLAGSALAEVVGLAVKGQRLDRLEAYVKCLEAELRDDIAAAKLDLNSQDALEFFEHGFQEAFATARRKRVAQIAKSVAHGFKTDPADQINREMVSTIAQLEPEDIALLNSIHTNAMDKRIRSTEVSDIAARGRLLRFGLIEFRPQLQQVPPSGRIGVSEKDLHVPTYDMLGRPTGDHVTTRLGLQALITMGLAKEPPPTSTITAFASE